MTFTVPPELEVSLADEARRRGITPERLVLEGVRKVLPIGLSKAAGVSLLDTLAGHVGSVAGTGEAFSRNGGERFADGLAAGRIARP